MKVFIIEDNAFYANVLNARIEKFTKQKVEIFSTGKEALNKMYLQPNLILLDYNLPDMKGIEILKQVKSTYPNIQVVILSAQEKIEVAVDSLKYGAMDYVIKNQTDDNLRIAKIFTDLKEIEIFNSKGNGSSTIFEKMLNRK